MPPKSKSPKGKEKGKSPKSKSSGKKKGSPISVGSQPLVVKDVKRKRVWTKYDIKDYTFKHFRCIRCHLVLNSFQNFIEHCCWRKYYAAKFHLGCTQAFACRNCELVFYSHGDYASHVCFDKKRCDELEHWEPEDVLPINYSEHHDFYIAWTRRVESEAKPHDPEYFYICRCSKCNNKFKTKIAYLTHSCVMFALLKPAHMRRFKTCMHCRYVFLNKEKYSKHIPYCNQNKEFCIDFAATATEIACQQFVLGRQCFDFDTHLHTGASFKERTFGEPPGNPPKPPPSLKPDPNMEVCCNECGFIQPNLLEFYYHPCVAGKLITPANLELTLCCCDCQCLFPDIEECISHFKACSTMKFSFVRLNTPELLRVALRRWSIEQAENPYLPARQVKFRCYDCNEIYTQFMQYLIHPCPRRERFERLLIQPLAVMETYTCEACHVVLFSVSESISHSTVCKAGDHPHMFQVHYNMDEVVAALTPWMRLPHLLQFDLSVGIGSEEDELALQEAEFRAANKIPQEDVIRRFHSKDERPSKRIEHWIWDVVHRPRPEELPPRLRDIPTEACVRRLQLLNIGGLAQNCRNPKTCDTGFKLTVED
ncbi:unnamed protein product [Schistocephalus solidus]|uniref:C2H2-type domain-containing protein n=1 Tax=Schistocephalus solidus TaxID=70667 RepID=A0A183SA90_SCHSO|nr:unnamed protein product [Schistocephalus solidus]